MRSAATEAQQFWDLIKAVKVPRELEDQLDASVRARFRELWDAAQVKDPLSED